MIKYIYIYIYIYIYKYGENYIKMVGAPKDACSTATPMNLVF